MINTDILNGARDLDQRMTTWAAAVHASQGGSMNDIRTACSSIIVRARKLATETPVKFDMVAPFLLEKTMNWAMNGTPLNLIIQNLPSNLRELGLMKMTEDFEEVKRIMGRPN